LKNPHNDNFYTRKLLSDIDEQYAKELKFANKFLGYKSPDYTLPDFYKKVRNVMDRMNWIDAKRRSINSMLNGMRPPVEMKGSPMDVVRLEDEKREIALERARQKNEEQEQQERDGEKSDTSWEERTKRLFKKAPRGQKPKKGGAKRKKSKNKSKRKKKSKRKNKSKKRSKRR
jgi:hypothetical protein